MKIRINLSNLIENMLSLLTVFLLFSFQVYDGKIWFIISMIFLFLSLLQSKFKISVGHDPFYIYGIVFSLFCMASALWAVYPKSAMDKGVVVFEIFVCISILYQYYSRFDSFDTLIKCIMWSGTLVALYTIFNVGLVNIIVSTLGGIRLEAHFQNINRLGMVSAMAIIVIAYFFLFFHEKKYLILAVPNFLIAVSSGSRKAIVLIFMGVALLLLMKNISRDVVKTIIKWIVMGIALLLAVKLLLSLPIFAMVRSRLDGLIAMVTGKGNMGASAQIRKSMISAGLQQFKKTPLLGIGFGNTGPVVLAGTNYSHSYLHNNFVEILVSGGILGFILYYLMYYCNLRYLIRNWRYRDSAMMFCMAVLICLLVMDYGQVSYETCNTYYYLMILFIYKKQHSRKLTVGIR